jgi:hypothetical protein
LALGVDGRQNKGGWVFTGQAGNSDHGLSLKFSGRHDLATGKGSADFRTETITFEPDRRQPADLFPVIGSALRRVAGSVATEGGLSWGGSTLGSSLSIDLDRVGFETGIAAISGLGGKLRFGQLLPLRTAGPQHLAASLGIASLPPGPVDLQFDLSGDRLQIGRATLGFAGGVLALDDVALSRDQPLRTALQVRQVDLGAILALIGIEGLSGTGSLNGRIPVDVGPAGMTIRDGQLAAAGPGVVRYTGSALPDTAAAPNAAEDSVGLLRRALADFHYTDLTLTLDRAATGEGSLLIGLKGANPAVLDGYPFAVNIRIEANFDRLATLFLDTYAAADGILRHAAGK